MRIKERIIRALGGFTRADVREQVDAAKRPRPALVLGVERRLPVRIMAEHMLSRPEDGEDRMERENMAYRLGAAMLERGLIGFQTMERADGIPVLRAQAAVVPPGAESKTPGPEGRGADERLLIPTWLQGDEEDPAR